MIIKSYINPSCLDKKLFDDFLNYNDFFDVSIDSYPNNEIYHIAFINNEIVGARKVLTGFQEYYKQTKWCNRFKGYIDKNKQTYYLQALAVKIEYRGHGVGSNLLKTTMDNIPKDISIFASLMDTNTLRNRYSDTYGFTELEEKDNRILISRI